MRRRAARKAGWSSSASPERTQKSQTLSTVLGRVAGLFANARTMSGWRSMRSWFWATISRMRSLARTVILCTATSGVLAFSTSISRYSYLAANRSA